MSAEQIPPWVHDRRPELWVPLGVAARFYFKLSPDGLCARIRRNKLDLPYWSDGTRYFIRLPTLIGPKAAKRA